MSITCYLDAIRAFIKGDITVVDAIYIISYLSKRGIILSKRSIQVIKKLQLRRYFLLNQLICIGLNSLGSEDKWLFRLTPGHEYELASRRSIIRYES